MTTYCLSLIGRPNRTDISEAVAAQLMELLPAPEKPLWLAEGEACDVYFEKSDEDGLRELQENIRLRLQDHPLDAAILPKENRRKSLLIADMDSTIIQQECIDEIADFAGLREHISGITERTMRGELVFEQALEERVHLLKGLPASTLQKVIDERIALMPGARTLVQTMRAHGAFTALVSGGFSFFTSRIAAMTGFQINQANILDIEEDTLTGEVKKPILGQAAKLEALNRLSDDNGIELSQTLAVGDGANDLAMIKAAGLGVAYHAKPKVAAEARVRIDHGDLTALLFLQGYRRAEFSD